MNGSLTFHPEKGYCVKRYAENDVRKKSAEMIQQIRKGRMDNVEKSILKLKKYPDEIYLYRSP